MDRGPNEDGDAHRAGVRNQASHNPHPVREDAFLSRCTDGCGRSGHDQILGHLNEVGQSKSLDISHT